LFEGFARILKLPLIACHWMKLRRLTNLQKEMKTHRPLPAGAFRKVD
jgi:hypothetical protein